MRNFVVRGPESSANHKVPAVFAAGLIAITGAVEVQSANSATNINARIVETRGNPDRLGMHINKNLRKILLHIENMAKHHSKNSQHIVQKDSSGNAFDRYTYAVPTTPSRPSDGYNQVVCIAPRGANSPIGCELLIGVEKPFAPAQPYVFGQFFEVGPRPNEYTLENIYPVPSGGFEQHYFDKEGSSYSHRYEIGNGPWQKEAIQEQKLETVYDHFLHNIMVLLEAGSPVSSSKPSA